MTPYPIRIIILSLSPDVISALQNAKARAETVPVAGLPEAEARVSRQRRNALLYDMDQIACGRERLVSLSRAYDLKIILTAASKQKTAGILKGEIDAFVMKPSIFTENTRKQFAGAVARSAGAAAPPAASPARPGAAFLAPGETKLWALAASTGGPEALEKIFRALPADIPPVLVVQHMPSGFTRLFAERLDRFCAMEIREAQNRDFLRRGLVLVAPADSHMKLVAEGGRLAVSCFAGQRIHGVMPAADVLFESVAEVMGKRGVGAVLTGMGRDGARGLLMMRQKGARTLCQDEESSVVYGMPRAAYELGAAEFVTPLDMVAEKLMSLT